MLIRHLHIERFRSLHFFDLSLNDDSTIIAPIPAAAQLDLMAAINKITLLNNPAQALVPSESPDLARALLQSNCALSHQTVVGRLGPCGRPLALPSQSVEVHPEHDVDAGCGGSCSSGCCDELSADDESCCDHSGPDGCGNDCGCAQGHCERAAGAVAGSGIGVGAGVDCAGHCDSAQGTDSEDLGDSDAQSAGNVTVKSGSEHESGIKDMLEFKFMADDQHLDTARYDVSIKSRHRNAGTYQLSRVNPEGPQKLSLMVTSGVYEPESNTAHGYSQVAVHIAPKGDGSSQDYAEAEVSRAFIAGADVIREQITVRSRNSDAPDISLQVTHKSHAGLMQSLSPALQGALPGRALADRPVLSDSKLGSMLRRGPVISFEVVRGDRTWLVTLNLTMQGSDQAVEGTDSCDGSLQGGAAAACAQGAVAGAEGITLPYDFDRPERRNVVVFEGDRRVNEGVTPAVDARDAACINASLDSRGVRCQVSVHEIISSCEDCRDQADAAEAEAAEAAAGAACAGAAEDAAAYVAGDEGAQAEQSAAQAAGSGAAGAVGAARRLIAVSEAERDEVLSWLSGVGPRYPVPQCLMLGAFCSRKGKTLDQVREDNAGYNSLLRFISYDEDEVQTLAEQKCRRAHNKTIPCEVNDHIDHLASQIIALSSGTEELIFYPGAQWRLIGPVSKVDRRFSIKLKSSQKHSDNKLPAWGTNLLRERWYLEHGSLEGLAQSQGGAPASAGAAAGAAGAAAATGAAAAATAASAADIMADVLGDMGIDMPDDELTANSDATGMAGAESEAAASAGNEVDADAFAADTAGAQSAELAGEEDEGEQDMMDDLLGEFGIEIEEEEEEEEVLNESAPDLNLSAADDSADLLAGIDAKDDGGDLLDGIDLDANDLELPDESDGLAQMAAGAEEAADDDLFDGVTDGAGTLYGADGADACAVDISAVRAVAQDEEFSSALDAADDLVVPDACPVDLGAVSNSEAQLSQDRDEELFDESDDSDLVMPDICATASDGADSLEGDLLDAALDAADVLNVPDACPVNLGISPSDNDDFDSAEMAAAAVSCASNAAQHASQAREDAANAAMIAAAIARDETSNAFREATNQACKEDHAQAAAFEEAAAAAVSAAAAPAEVDEQSSAAGETTAEAAGEATAGAAGGVASADKHSEETNGNRPKTMAERMAAIKAAASARKAAREAELAQEFGEQQAAKEEALAQEEDFASDASAAFDAALSADEGSEAATTDVAASAGELSAGADEQSLDMGAVADAVAHAAQALAEIDLDSTVTAPAVEDTADAAMDAMADAADMDAMADADVGLDDSLDAGSVEGMDEQSELSAVAADSSDDAQNQSLSAEDDLLAAAESALDSAELELEAAAGSDAADAELSTAATADDDCELSLAELNTGLEIEPAAQAGGDDENAVADAAGQIQAADGLDSAAMEDSMTETADESLTGSMEEVMSETVSDADEAVSESVSESMPDGLTEGLAENLAEDLTDPDSAQSALSEEPVMDLGGEPADIVEADESALVADDDLAVDAGSADEFEETADSSALAAVAAADDIEMPEMAQEAPAAKKLSMAERMAAVKAAAAARKAAMEAHDEPDMDMGLTLDSLSEAAAEDTPELPADDISAGAPSDTEALGAGDAAAQEVDADAQAGAAADQAVEAVDDAGAAALAASEAMDIPDMAQEAPAAKKISMAERMAAVKAAAAARKAAMEAHDEPDMDMGLTLDSLSEAAAEGTPELPADDVSACAPSDAETVAQGAGDTAAQAGDADAQAGDASHQAVDDVADAGAAALAASEAMDIPDMGQEQPARKTSMAERMAAVKAAAAARKAAMDAGNTDDDLASETDMASEPAMELNDSVPADEMADKFAAGDVLDGLTDAPDLSDIAAFADEAGLDSISGVLEDPKMDAEAAVEISHEDAIGSRQDKDKSVNDELSGKFKADACIMEDENFASDSAAAFDAAVAAEQKDSHRPAGSGTKGVNMAERMAAIKAAAAARKSGEAHPVLTAQPVMESVSTELSAQLEKAIEVTDDSASGQSDMPPAIDVSLAPQDQPEGQLGADIISDISAPQDEAVQADLQDCDAPAADQADDESEGAAMAIAAGDEPEDAPELENAIESADPGAQSADDLVSLVAEAAGALDAVEELAGDGAPEPEDQSDELTATHDMSLDSECAGADDSGSDLACDVFDEDESSDEDTMAGDSEDHGRGINMAVRMAAIKAAAAARKAGLADTVELSADVGAAQDGLFAMTDDQHSADQQAAAASDELSESDADTRAVGDDISADAQEDAFESADADMAASASASIDDMNASAQDVPAEETEELNNTAEHSSGGESAVQGVDMAERMAAIKAAAAARKAALDAEAVEAVEAEQSAIIEEDEDYAQLAAEEFEAAASGENGILGKIVEEEEVRDELDLADAADEEDELIMARELDLDDEDDDLIMPDNLDSSQEGAAQFDEALASDTMPADELAADPVAGETFVGDAASDGEQTDLSAVDSDMESDTSSHSEISSNDMAERMAAIKAAAAARKAAIREEANDAVEAHQAAIMSEDEDFAQIAAAEFDAAVSGEIPAHAGQVSKSVAMTDDMDLLEEGDDGDMIMPEDLVLAEENARPAESVTMESVAQAMAEAAGLQDSEPADESAQDLSMDMADSTADLMDESVCDNMADTEQELMDEPELAAHDQDPAADLAEDSIDLESAADAAADIIDEAISTDDVLEAQIEAQEELAAIAEAAVEEAADEAAELIGDDMASEEDSADDFMGSDESADLMADAMADAMGQEDSSDSPDLMAGDEAALMEETAEAAAATDDLMGSDESADLMADAMGEADSADSADLMAGEEAALMEETADAMGEADSADSADLMADDEAALMEETADAAAATADLMGADESADLMADAMADAMGEADSADLMAGDEAALMEETAEAAAATADLMDSDESADLMADAMADAMGEVDSADLMADVMGDESAASADLPADLAAAANFLKENEVEEPAEDKPAAETAQDDFIPAVESPSQSANPAIDAAYAVYKDAKETLTEGEPAIEASFAVYEQSRGVLTGEEKPVIKSGDKEVPKKIVDEAASIAMVTAYAVYKEAREDLVTDKGEPVEGASEAQAQSAASATDDLMSDVEAPAATAVESEDLAVADALCAVEELAQGQSEAEDDALASLGFDSEDVVDTLSDPEAEARAEAEADAAMIEAAETAERTEEMLGEFGLENASEGDDEPYDAEAAARAEAEADAAMIEAAETAERTEEMLGEFGLENDSEGDDEPYDAEAAARAEAEADAAMIEAAETAERTEEMLGEFGLENASEADDEPYDAEAAARAEAEADAAMIEAAETAERTEEMLGEFGLENASEGDDEPYDAEAAARAEAEADAAMIEAAETAERTEEMLGEFGLENASEGDDEPYDAEAAARAEAEADAAMIEAAETAERTEEMLGEFGLENASEGDDEPYDADAAARAEAEADAAMIAAAEAEEAAEADAAIIPADPELAAEAVSEVANSEDSEYVSDIAGEDVAAAEDNAVFDVESDAADIENANAAIDAAAEAINSAEAEASFIAGAVEEQRAEAEAGAAMMAAQDATSESAMEIAGVADEPASEAAESSEMTGAGAASEMVVAVEQEDQDDEFDDFVDLSSARTVHSLGDEFSLTLDDSNTASFISTHCPDALEARFWLLVEGSTDTLTLTNMAHEMGINLKRAGLHIVRFIGTSLNILIELAQRMGIDYLILCDEDQGASSVLKNLELPASLDKRRHNALLSAMENLNRLGEAGNAAFPQADDIAARFAALKANSVNHVVFLPGAWLEIFLFNHGFAHVYLKAAFSNQTDLHTVNYREKLASEIKRMRSRCNTLQAQIKAVEKAQEAIFARAALQAAEADATAEEAAAAQAQAAEEAARMQAAQARAHEEAQARFVEGLKDWSPIESHNDDTLVGQGPDHKLYSIISTIANEPEGAMSQLAVLLRIVYIKARNDFLLSRGRESELLSDKGDARYTFKIPTDQGFNPDDMTMNDIARLKKALDRAADSYTISSSAPSMADSTWRASFSASVSLVRSATMQAKNLYQKLQTRVMRNNMLKGHPAQSGATPAATAAGGSYTATSCPVPQNLRNRVTAQAAAATVASAMVTSAATGGKLSSNERNAIKDTYQKHLDDEIKELRTLELIYQRACLKRNVPLTADEYEYLKVDALNFTQRAIAARGKMLLATMIVHDLNNRGPEAVPDFMADLLAGIISYINCRSVDSENSK
ncbi:hypothetical protein MXE40_10010 [Anaerobiospirillum sp. NML02-A-032]|uniref:TOPRIM nucleotidyl transferase/hydrolase domain-containing protein n=1 Tax=Anaerobiospirillum sp. NML02-A-032 TaxID=2932818 RepID=UPI001FF4218F|nr:TOPRIM nucleotidyl transferase/hydrolase domain-containing protein [Anaerobiospirillum sp. NML02-A-032]MCK0540820.1 hypothetical protein [Anaerobiospirillum sp. NML02-A-032]